VQTKRLRNQNEKWEWRRPTESPSGLRPPCGVLNTYCWVLHSTQQNLLSTQVGWLNTCGPKIVGGTDPRLIASLEWMAFCEEY
jgi:hypothetical protein